MKMSNAATTGVLFLLIVLASCVLECVEAAEAIDFNRDIRPLLSDRCFLCHGPDEAARQAELRLDNYADATQWAIVPGDADGSELIARIATHDAELVMPTPESNKARLSDVQIELFRQWINEGAQYAQHWAYAIPKKVQLPQVENLAWNKNPIDTFIHARLNKLGLSPAEPADRATILRRLSLDVTGLPPSPEDLERFLADSTPDAILSVVNPMLGSMAHAEHMTRYWLDAARYADSNGYQYDFARDQWAWRDWVINAFQQNMPFDQFTIEQIAGDLLPDATEQQRLATGFNRNHPITVEGGIIDEEYRTEYVIDRVTTTGTVWLGATLICSRCHDHKYDPTTQAEFFSLYDFFNQIPEKGMRGFAPQAAIPSPLQISAIQRAEQDVEQVTERFRAAFASWSSEHPVVEPHTSGAADLWITPRPVALKSTGGSRLQIEEEATIFVEGEAPKQDVYELEYELEYELVDEVISLIRLEALTDPRLPGGGASRSSNSNFVLSEFSVEMARVAQNQNDMSYRPQRIDAASADYAQRNYPVTAAIDGKVDGAGWAVDGNVHAKRGDRQAIFTLQSPIETQGQATKIRITLHFQSSFAQHAIGKFRISFARDLDLLLSDDLTKALATPEEQRSPEQQLAVQRHIASTFGTPQLRVHVRELSEAQNRLAEIKKSIPSTMIMQEQPERRESFILIRGEYDRPSDRVRAGTPAYLPPLSAELPRNRLGLAKWLVSPENPLTARVTVNRIWQQFFGVGLVDTPEDFGLQGNMPSHPELLDWLAVEFVESGWDVQHLIRMIVTSQTYLQSSSITPEAVARDPHNRLLSRGPRMRLEAEIIRDSALAVSGLLNRAVGGPSVFPYHPAGLWLEVNNRPGYSSAYEQDHGDNLYRRSLYTFWKRTVPPPSMAVFDAPDRETCQVRRSRTNTPLQAFIMLHDPQFVEAARNLAERVLRDGGATPEEQVRFGFRTCVGREPLAAESAILVAAYEDDLRYFTANAHQAQQLLRIGESAVDESIEVSQLAAMSNVARLIMNLSEFVTKG